MAGEIRTGSVLHALSRSDVVIAGAGIAGLAIGLLLSRRGARVTVLERYADPRRETPPPCKSINLALSHRGLRALSLLGALPQLSAHLVPMRGRMVHTDAADVFHPYDFDLRSAIYSVRRDRIIATLLRLADREPGLRVQFGSECLSVDLGGRSLIFRDTPAGSPQAAPFNRLIGADGCHSAVRAAILRRAREPEQIVPLDHAYKELHIAPQSDPLLHASPDALHIWPRGEFMLIALPNPDGSYTATLFLPKTGPESFHSLRDFASVAMFFERHLGRFGRLGPLLSRQFSESSLGTLVTVLPKTWNFEETALILGDAAHTMTPFLGQGMNCALEDCRLLAELMDAAQERAFSEFARLRKPDAAAISRLSDENYLEMRQQVLEPEYLRKRELSRLFTDRHPDRFVPLYHMVSFSSVPYSEAAARASIQDRIIQACAGNGTPNLALADRLILERLPALCRPEAGSHLLAPENFPSARHAAVGQEE